MGSPKCSLARVTGFSDSNWAGGDNRKRKGSPKCSLARVTGFAGSNWAGGDNRKRKGSPKCSLARLMVFLLVPIGLGATIEKERQPKVFPRKTHGFCWFQLGWGRQ